MPRRETSEARPPGARSLRSRPSRRSVLSAIGAAATTALAGCPFGPPPERHHVDVLNGSDLHHVFAVTVADDAGDVLFEREYDLDARTGDENRVIEGAPARVAVAVDGAEPVQFPWAPREHPSFAPNVPNGCPEGTSTSLTVWYRRQSEAVVEPTYGCETARG